LPGNNHEEKPSMISKLPGWVLVGGAVLAFIAGIINSVGFLGFQHQGVTHLTGSTTLLGISFADQNTVSTLHLIAVIGSFFAGAVLSGILIQNSALKLGRRYGVALVIESGLLILAVPFLYRNNTLGDYLASCACGLQNAMASTYSGAVIRTCHVSGFFTDLGVAVGHLIRGIPSDKKRIRLYSTLVLSFFSGGVVGALTFSYLSYSTLYLPAALTGSVGLAYTIYKMRHRDEF
jgi:uncharacterized membrane protein YoaK (UPF0700 family)